jgi:hypothetical protein
VTATTETLFSDPVGGLNQKCLGLLPILISRGLDFVVVHLFVYFGLLLHPPRFHHRLEVTE